MQVPFTLMLELVWGIVEQSWHELGLSSSNKQTTVSKGTMLRRLPLGLFKQILCLSGGVIYRLISLCIIGRIKSIKGRCIDRYTRNTGRIQ